MEKTIFVWQDLNASTSALVDYFSQPKKRQKEQMRLAISNPGQYIFREIVERKEDRRGEDWCIDDFFTATKTSVPEGRVSVLGGMMSSEYRRVRGRDAKALRRSKILGSGATKTMTKVYDSVDDLDIFYASLHKHRLGIVDSNMVSKTQYKVLDYQDVIEVYGSFVIKDGELIFRTPKGEEYEIPKYLKNQAWAYHQKAMICDCAIGKVEKTNGDRREVEKIAMVYDFRSAKESKQS